MEEIQQRMAEVTWPYLLMQGTADRLVLPAGSELFHSKTPSGDKTLNVNWCVVIELNATNLPPSSAVVISRLLSSNSQ